jgi:hypothetical protein
MALALDGEVIGGNGGADDAVVLTTSAAGQICVVITVNNTTVSSITDSAGLTYSLRATSGGASPIELWSARSNGAQASNTITVTYAGTATFGRVIAFGVSGTDASDPWDDHASTPNTGTSDPATVSTTASDTFIIGAFRGSTSDPTAGTDYTEIGTQNGSFTLVEYKIVAAPQTGLSVTVGTGVGTMNGAIGDALQAEDAPGTEDLIGSSSAGAQTAPGNEHSVPL